MTVKRMDNIGIVVEDIDAAIVFFTELGLTLEGRAPIEGEWAPRHRIARAARRDRHAAHPRRPQPPRAVALPRPRHRCPITAAPR